MIMNTYDIQKHSLNSYLCIYQNSKLSQRDLSENQHSNPIENFVEIFGSFD